MQAMETTQRRQAGITVVYKRCQLVYYFDDRIDDQQLETVDMRHTCAQRAPQQFFPLRDDRVERRRRSIVHETAKRWVRAHTTSGGLLGRCEQSPQPYTPQKENAAGTCILSSNATAGGCTIGVPACRVNTDEMPRASSSSTVPVTFPHKQKHCNAHEREHAQGGQAVAARVRAMFMPAKVASQKRSDALHVHHKQHASIASASALEADIGSEALGTVPLFEHSRQVLALPWAAATPWAAAPASRSSLANPAGQQHCSSHLCTCLLRTSRYLLLQACRVCRAMQ